MNPVTGTGCTILDICVGANLESVDKFCGPEYTQGIDTENKKR